MSVRHAYVPRAQSTDKRFFGVVEAIVVDVFDPAKEGRVKVQFPWFDDDMVTDWCRVCQLYAGNGYGSLFVPEVKDEVLVGFIHGDMRLPVILGGIYNGQDKPSSHREKTKDQKLIRTKAGHELIFDDQDKKLTVKTPAGMTLALDDNAKTVTLETASGQSVVLDASSAAITIEATHVELGQGASEPVILGTTFATFFATHVHTTGIPGLPTSPPVVPMPPNALSTKVMAG
jgi:uncharacterized protein involved in type VI secretion and phage assembly